MEYAAPPTNISATRAISHHLYFESASGVLMGVPSPPPGPERLVASAGFVPLCSGASDALSSGTVPVPETVNPTGAPAAVFWATKTDIPASSPLDSSFEPGAGVICIDFG